VTRAALLLIFATGPDWSFKRLTTTIPIVGNPSNQGQLNEAEVPPPTS